MGLTRKKFLKVFGLAVGETTWGRVSSEILLKVGVTLIGFVRVKR